MFRKIIAVTLMTFSLVGLVQAQAPDAKRANEFAPTVKSRDGVVPAARIARAAQATAWFT